MKKKIFLLPLVTTLILSSFMPISDAEDETIDIKIEPINFFNSPPHLRVPKVVNHMKNSGWPQIYDKGIEDSASAIAIDSQGNIIVTGYTGYITKTFSEEVDFLTIKYDSEGNELWNVTYDSGSFDYAWDITIDSADNIILLGFNWTSYEDLQELNLYIRIVKYDKDGVKQWNVTYHKAINNYPGGIKVDSQDNIIISSGYGNIDALDFFCWTLKLDSDGTELWNQTFYEDLFSIGTDVTVDSIDNIIVGGMSASFFGQGYYIVKYDSNGNKVAVHRYQKGTQPNALVLDKNENIILTGHGYSSFSNSGTWFTMKCDKQGKLLWVKEYDSGTNDAAEDVYVDSQHNIVTVGVSSFSEDNFEQCAIIYDKDGNEICMKRPGINGAINGVIVDNADNIFVTGTINQSYDYGFYTDRYIDITPPSVNLTKPEKKHLYLFNIKLFPLSKNTIILGKITVTVEADNPSDVMKVEFYIDNVLKETITEPNYQWTWSGGMLLSKRILRVMAYDESGSITRYQFLVWKPF